MQFYSSGPSIFESNMNTLATKAMVMAAIDKYGILSLTVV